MSLGMFREFVVVFILFCQRERIEIPPSTFKVFTENPSNYSNDIQGPFEYEWAMNEPDGVRSPSNTDCRCASSSCAVAVSFRDGLAVTRTLSSSPGNPRATGNQHDNRTSELQNFRTGGYPHAGLRDAQTVREM